ncbi:zinc-binding dehydrogenase [Arthrobacter sp. NA-172]|uniref:zinc-binding dehydrogenase n=1 Tax=Arthrobacter sp. NA-172 TaxID=3367524 RepID=UPI0037548ABC
MISPGTPRWHASAGRSPLAARPLSPAAKKAASWTGSIDRQFRALALSPFISQKLTMVMGTQGVADLEYLAGLLDAGTLTPIIDRSYPLEQVPDAMRYFDAGRVRGKIAITIQEAQGN